MPRYLILNILLTVFLAFIPAYPKITVDFTGYSPEDVVTMMTNFGIGHFDAVVLSHPFRTYGSPGNTDGIIYDWTDTGGGKSQQSGLNTLYGNLDGFKKLVDFLKKNKVAVICKADIFSQYMDFNLDLWKATDFSPDSINYYDYHFVNLKNDTAKDKIRQMLAQMKSMPVDKWIIDLSKVPLKEQADYFAFVRDNAGWATVLFSHEPEIYKNYKDKASSYYYSLLMETILSSTNRLDSSIYSEVKPDVIHFVPDRDVWINHFAVGLYLAANFPGTVIPASFIALKSGKSILSHFVTDMPYSCVYHGLDTIVMYSKSGKKIIAINLSVDLASVKLDMPMTKKGVIKSVMGNYPLQTDSSGSYILIPPGSVYIWEIQ